MARIVNTDTTVNNAVRIINTYEDGTSDIVDIFEDEMVESLKYIENGEIKEISGKVSYIDFLYLTATEKIGSRESYFNNDVELSAIYIDKSTKYHSDVVKIPAKEIFTYKEREGAELESIDIRPYVNILVLSETSDGNVSTLTLTEGTRLNGLTIQEKGKETVLDGDIVSFYYKKYKHTERDAMYLGFNIKGDADRLVLFDTVKTYGSQSLRTSSDVENIADAIAEIKDSTYGGIILPVKEYNDDFTIDSSIAISGKQMTIPANTGARRSDITDNETVINGNVTIKPGMEVTFDGVTFSKNAHITVGGAAKLKIRNCRFVDLTSYQTKSYIIYDARNAGNGVVIDIQNCYFGNNGKTATMYNGLELWGKIKDGSVISNNYFAKNVVSHNVINLYGCSENAVIKITGNVFEYSANAIRLGFVDDPKVTVYIDNNVYYDTDPYNGYEWAGILIIQPCGKATKSFAGMSVYLNSNEGPSTTKQVTYIYCGKDDTQLDDSTIPTVRINNRLVKLPILH